MIISNVMMAHYPRSMHTSMLLSVSGNTCLFSCGVYNWWMSLIVALRKMFRVNQNHNFSKLVNIVTSRNVHLMILLLCYMLIDELQLCIFVSKKNFLPLASNFNWKYITNPSSHQLYVGITLDLDFDIKLHNSLSSLWYKTQQLLYIFMF